MGDLKHLVHAEEADGVGTGLGTAPESVDADLFGGRLPQLPSRPYTGVYSWLGSMASSSSFAVPLGASTFWLWWVSTISISKSGFSTSLICSSTRRNTATPTE